MPGGVDNDGGRSHTGVRQLDGSGDERVEHLVLERLIDTLAYLLAVEGVGVHGHQHAVDLQRGIDAGLDLLDGLHEQSHATKGKEFGGHRNDHAIGCGQGVHREQAKRRLAIHDDDIVFGLELAQHTVENLFSAHLGDQLDFGRRQVNVCRNHIDVVERGVLHHIMGIHRHIEQCGVNGALHGIRIDAQAHGGGTLRIKVDDKHSAAILCQSSGDVNGTRGLAHTALLVAHGNDSSRTVLLQRFGSREGFVFTSKKIGRHIVYLINIRVPRWCSDIRFVHRQRTLAECAAAATICHA